MSDTFIDYDGKKSEDGTLRKKFGDNVHISSFIKCIDESNGFIIFAGAGVSKLCGLPLWNELANKLLEKCYNDELISFFDKNDLSKNVGNDKMLISIIHSKYQEAGRIDDFYNAFNILLKNNPNSAKEKRLVNALKQLRASIITTNADKILDKCVLVENVLYGKKFDKLDSTNLQDILEGEPKVFHIHGRVGTKIGLIFTIEEYIDRYNDEEFIKKISSLLRSSNIPVLFLGTSMTELELLQYIFFRGKAEENNRFILSGYYDYQESMAKTFEVYYKKFDITQITYSLNDNGYDLQLEFLEDISKYNLDYTSVTTKIYDDLLACIKKGKIKSITEDIILKEKTLSDSLFDRLLSEINRLKNPESVYNLLLKNNKMYSISELFSTDGKNKSKCVFYSFCVLNPVNNVRYNNVVKYYSTNIMKYLKSNVKDTKSIHTLLYNYVELLGKNVNFLEDDMIDFYDWLMTNNHGLVDEMIYSLRKYDLSPKLCFKTGCNILDYYLNNESKFFDSEMDSFFNKNLMAILKYRGYDFLLKIYQTIKKVVNQNKIAYKDMGAICDYSKDRFPKFNHFIINLFDNSIRAAGPSVAKELYKTVGNETIDKKIKIHMLDVFYKYMNENLFDIELYNSIDTFAPLCWLVMHNRDDLTEKTYKKFKEIINQSSFGCDSEEDAEALRDILISKLDGTTIIEKNNSRYYHWEFQNIGKLFWTGASKDLSSNKKDQIGMTSKMDIFDLIEYIVSKKVDDIFDFSNDILSNYFSNEDNLLKLFENYVLFEKISPKYHYSTLKIITINNDISKEKIIGFLTKIDYMKISYWILIDIIYANNLIQLYSDEVKKIIQDKYDKELNENYSDYFDRKKELSDYVINNGLYNISRLLIECKIQMKESIKDFYLNLPQIENAIFVKYAIISKVDSFDDKQWYINQIENILDKSDNYLKADIYEQLLYTKLNRIIFINNNNFFDAFECMNQRIQNCYIHECLFRFEIINEEILDYICKKTDVQDFDYFLNNYFNNPNYDAEKISLLCKKVLEKKEIDDFIFSNLLEVIARNKNDKQTKKICSKFYNKQPQHMLFWEDISKPIVKLAVIDENFAIKEVLYNLVTNFLNVSDYDYKDELYNLFNEIIKLNLNKDNREIIRQLSIKAFACGMLKFKKLTKIK